MDQFTDGCSFPRWGWAYSTRGYRLRQDTKPEHWDHPTVPSQLHAGVLELAQSPYPDGTGSPNRVGLHGKSSCKGSTWGSTACKQAAPWTPAPQVFLLRRHTAWKIFLWLLGWGRAGGKEAVSKWKICSLSLNLKWNWRSIFKYQACYLILKAPLLWQHRMKHGSNTALSFGYPYYKCDSRFGSKWAPWFISWVHIF